MGNKTKSCRCCGIVKPLTEFYRVPNKAGRRSKCKNCMREYKRERRRGMKSEAVSYKGGGCQVCGYDKCIDALEFHHIDPAEKDSVISDLFSLKKMKAEADKCALLCANCHREVHAGIVELP
tara:strand:+ start:1683 stop:2048 length:366 start_codon:yes stop_codon:yes gene_type:complete